MSIKTQIKIKKSAARELHQFMSRHQALDRSFTERFGSIALAVLALLSIAEASHELARRVIPEIALQPVPVVVDNGERAELVRHPYKFEEGERAAAISGV